MEFLPGKDGLLHVSEIDHKRVEKVEDVLKEGDRVRVKLIDIDPKTGKFKFPVRCCCLNRKVWSKMIVKIAASAKIEANVKIAGLGKIGEIAPIATEVLDRKEKKIKNNI